MGCELPALGLPDVGTTDPLRLSRSPLASGSSHRPCSAVVPHCIRDIRSNPISRRRLVYSLTSDLGPLRRGPLALWCWRQHSEVMGTSPERGAS